jgi:hypothetical protein
VSPAGGASVRAVWSSGSPKTDLAPMPALLNRNTLVLANQCHSAKDIEQEGL